MKKSIESEMHVTCQSIPDVMVIEPKVFGDGRGFFYESFNQRAFSEATGTNHQFVQDNHSRSSKGVLRGMHCQIGKPQGKLVRVVQGAIFDVAVDLRKLSPTFGQWVGKVLSAENKLQMWVPPCFAHGFLALADVSEVIYKTTDYWDPHCENIIRWDDPLIRIDWPLSNPPVLAAKDAVAPLLDLNGMYY